MEIDVVIAKGAIHATISHLEQLNELLKEKNPNHEMIGKNEFLIKELWNSYETIIQLKNSVYAARQEAVTAQRINLEMMRDNDKLKEQIKQIQEFL